MKNLFRTLIALIAILSLACMLCSGVYSCQTS